MTRGSMKNSLHSFLSAVLLTRSGLIFRNQQCLWLFGFWKQIQDVNRDHDGFTLLEIRPWVLYDDREGSEHRDIRGEQLDTHFASSIYD